MDRREFFKSMLLTPLFTPMLLASKNSANDAEIFLISDTPQRFLPPLLKELQSMHVFSGRSHSGLEANPRSDELIQELERQGVPRGISARLSLSSSHLQAAVQPSFTLARKGRVWDIRTRKLFSLWEKLNNSPVPSSLLTIASFKKNPSSQHTGESVSLYKNGRKTKTLSLKKDSSLSYRTQEGRIKVKIEKGRAWVGESSCRHKICVHCPPASHTGERIICAPNRFYLEINGAESVDSIIG